MYYIAMTLAAIGGLLIGIVIASIYYIYLYENAELYEDDDWWEDDEDQT